MCLLADTSVAKTETERKESTTLLWILLPYHVLVPNQTHCHHNVSNRYHPPHSFSFRSSSETTRLEKSGCSNIDVWQQETPKVGKTGVGLLKTEQINRWHNEMTTAFECTKKWRVINMVTSRVSESYIFDVSKAVIGKSTLDADKVIANNVVRCNELLVGNVSPLLCINTTFPI